MVGVDVPAVPIEVADVDAVAIAIHFYFLIRPVAGMRLPKRRESQRTSVSWRHCFYKSAQGSKNEVSCSTSALDRTLKESVNTLILADYQDRKQAMSNLDLTCMNLLDIIVTKKTLGIQTDNQESRAKDQELTKFSGSKIQEL